MSELRTQTDGVSTMLTGVYESAHKTIAVGAPALTRQQADAALELFYFMAGQLEGILATPSPAAKTAWASGLGRTWATLPAETRNAVAAMPMTWALTVAVWPEMTPAVREQIKGSYAQSDVVKGLRSDFVAARNQVSPNAPSSAAAPRQGRDAVDVSAEVATINQNYQATSSMLTSSDNSTISMMAAFGNMSGPRSNVR